MFVIFVIFVILAIAAILLSERTIEKIACAHGRSRKIADATMTGIVTLLCIMDSAYAFAISIGSIPKWICIIALIVLLVLAADRETIIIGIILSLMLVVITLSSLADSMNELHSYRATELKEKYGLETTVVMLHTDGTSISDIASWLDLTPDEIMEIIKNRDAL